jgi:putative nucleotidyltransferase with HDIG domain
MAIDPSIEEQDQLADSFRRPNTRMAKSELVAGVVGSSAFAAAVAGVWVLRPPHSFAIVPALVCMLVLLLAMMIVFETPFGFTDATQLGFVPLLFAMPLVFVPLAMALAQGVSWLPRLRSGELRPDRLLMLPGITFFAFGPVLVLAVANVEPRDAGAGLLLAALAAQFLVNFIVATMHHLLVRGVSFSAVLSESWAYAIDAALSGIALVVAEDVHTAPAAALALVPLLGLLAMFAHERGKRLQSMLELSSAYRGTALVLGDVIEADDGYTGEHCKSVVSLALELAEQLRLSPERQRNLEFAALLHDVGKIAIPKEIINKPGKLDPHEWTIIKTHTLEGQKMLERVGGFMRQVGIIVRSHHERWDGGGYPDGLAGEAIPLEARIITCCDTWNAMRTDRPYRKALSHDMAVAELVANAGGQFDPDVVETFLELVAPTEQADTAAVTAGGHVRAPAQLIAGSAGS